MVSVILITDKGRGRREVDMDGGSDKKLPASFCLNVVLPDWLLT